MPDFSYEQARKMMAAQAHEQQAKYAAANAGAGCTTRGPERRQVEADDISNRLNNRVQELICIAKRLDNFAARLMGPRNSTSAEALSQKVLDNPGALSHRLNMVDTQFANALAELQSTMGNLETFA